MKYIADRIEGDLAVCEDENEEMVNIPLKNLPEGVKEGSVLILDGETWILDESEEELRRQRIQAKFQTLMK